MQRLGTAARELAVEKKKTCRIEAQGIEGNFFADGGLIEEVFDNLVSNALRYAQNGIIVAFVRSGEEFLIYVRDDGADFLIRRFGTARTLITARTRKGEDILAWDCSFPGCSVRNTGEH